MFLECIPDYKEAEQWAQLAQKFNAGFEYNEFFRPDILDNNALTEEIIHIYSSLGRAQDRDTLHGAFLDICVNSDDPMIKKASDYRVEQCLDIASRMGVRGVVFHTNYITGFSLKSYRELWVERNADYWHEKLEKYPMLNIYMENMFDESPELLGSLYRELSDCGRFGICFDIAHANLSKVNIDEWINAFSGGIKHIHINDNDGLEDLHLALGEGIIEWSVLKRPELSLQNPSVLIEVSGRDRFNKSVEFLTGRGLL